MDLRNSYQYSNLQSQNWTESCQEVQKKIINSNPNLVSQKWWHLNPSIYWNLANLNPNLSRLRVHLWSFSCIGHVKDKEAYFFCCDRKARAASAQSFILWQQATTEITRRDHSIIACSRHICLCDTHHAHSVRDESHFQRNANWEVATTSSPFCNEPYRSHILFVKVAPGTPSHPGHSTTLLQLESPNAKRETSHWGGNLHAHPVRGESYIQLSANQEVTTLAAMMG